MVQLVVAAAAVVLLRAAMICCTVLLKWLLRAVTLGRLSLADGMVLTRTWSPTVSRQLGFAPAAAAASEELPSEVDAAVGSMGMMAKPMGRIGMQDGFSPLMASWMASTSMVE